MQPAHTISAHSAAKVCRLPCHLAQTVHSIKHTLQLRQLYWNFTLDLVSDTWTLEQTSKQTVSCCPAGAASALLCLSLAQALDVDCGECCPEPTAAETAEVLGHSLKDRQGAGVVPWALLTLLYRNQGESEQALHSPTVHRLC